MMPSVELIRFFIKHHDILTAQPISGCISTIHQLFVSDGNTATKDINFAQFKNQLERIIQLDKYSIVFNDHQTIDFINPLNLNVMLNLKDVKQQPEKRVRRKEKVQPARNRDNPVSLSLSYLEELLEPTPHPKGSVNYHELECLLKFETTCQKLSKFEIAQTTPMVPFLETCNDPAHAEILAKQQYQQQSKISKDLECCLQVRIHYIPMIKPHTDSSLGDCSYLDTCHKLDTCRYIHYMKHVPQKQWMRQVEQANQFNEQIPYFEKINGWVRNGSVSNLTRTVLESQWINCDIRNFNFNILGKFAAVIADPPWNIHMNLPYGTCNDNELLSLPLNNIQEEGIILLWVTGRAIEIGKESLTKWGYKIKNELIWIKSNQLSRTICTGRTGHWLNHSKEHLLVGVKGNPEWLERLIDVDYIVSQTRETSRKPDELYGMVERLVGLHARKLEIFGRDHNVRPGWFTIGNQLSGNNIVETDVEERYKSLM